MGNLKNMLEDEEKGIADKISEEEKEEIENAVSEALEWLDDNQEAEKEEFEEKKKEVEGIANPIIQKVYRNLVLRAAPMPTMKTSKTRMKMNSKCIRSSYAVGSRAHPPHFFV